MKVFGNLDLQINQLLKHRLEQLSTDPIDNLVSGRIWYNTTDNVIKYYDGTQIRVVVEGSSITNVSNLISDLQAELDATQTGAGLDTDGDYTANASTNYLSAATSLKNADELLDSQIKTVADGLSDEITNRTTADTNLQTELDATQTGAGLDTDGGYTANTSTNYLSAATSLKNADELLDSQIKTVSDTVNGIDLQTVYNQTAPDGSGAAGITLTTGKDFRIYDDTDSSVYFQIDSETGAITITGDLIVNGSTTTVESTITDSDHWLISPSAGTVKALEINPDSGVTFTTDVIDVKVTNNGDSVFKVNAAGSVVVRNGILTDKFAVNDQTVSDQNIGTTGTINLGHKYIQETGFVVSAKVSGVDAVLGTDYTVDYVNGTITIINDFDSTPQPTVSYSYHPTFDGRNISLDGQTLDAHINNSNVEIKHTGSMIEYSNTVSGLSSTTVQGAIDELKTLSGDSTSQISDLQAELDATQAGAGLNTDGSYSPDTNANYIASSTSLKNSDSLLDAQIKTVADDLAAEIVNRTDADTSIRNDFGSTDTGKGASLVGVNGSFTNATGTNVQSILSGFDTAITNAGKRYLVESATLTYNSGTNLYEISIAHNLGHKYVSVTCYENDEIIIPHSVLAIDANTTKVTFTTNITPTIKIIG